jgi:predicted lipid-binding transport protein (Tim44 family)
MVHLKWARRALFVMVLALMCFQAMEWEALARAGAGGSSGSRGSRPLAPPSRSYSTPSPSQPSQQQRQYAPGPPPSSPSRSPFWHGLAGGLLGGLIGGMLFRSLGFAGPGMGGWGGPGLFDLILIGALLYAIYWFAVRRRRSAALEQSSQAYQGAIAGAEPVTVVAQEVPYDGEAGDPELLRGLGHIRQMDPGFQVQDFKEEAMDIFFKVQAAWAQRDMTQARGLLTEEMFRILQGQVEQLRGQGRINRLENVAVRAVEPVEVWQEAGQDFITVRIRANLLDYTMEESTGRVVSGSDRDPVKFEEYWTFTRQVGPNSWKLSAITQV